MTSPMTNNKDIKNALIDNIPKRIFTVLKEHYHIDLAMPNEDLPTDLLLQATALYGSVLKDKMEARKVAMRREIELEEWRIELKNREIALKNREIALQNKEIGLKDREITFLRRQIQKDMQGIHEQADGERE